MRGFACLISAVSLLLSLSSCGTLPTAINNESGAGSLSMQLWVGNSLAKSSKMNETTWDSLIISISAVDMSPVIHAFPVNPLQVAILDTITGIPEGNNRLVEAWTSTKEGQRIHSGTSMISHISAGETVPVAIQLNPVRGSIYIDLAQVPSNVDSVFAAFIFGSDSLVASGKRSSIMSLSIDNIPDGTQGILVIRGKDVAGQILYEDSLEFTFYTMKNSSMQAQFLAKPAGLVMEIAIQVPGVTVVSGEMSTPLLNGVENGGLIISEIMYYSEGDSDYIEIHNPALTDFYADTLMVEIINTSGTTTARLIDVSIPADGYYVIGDADAPVEWVDMIISMDLTTTSRWIILKSKDGMTMDWVVYLNNDQGWPKGVKSYSIELDKSVTDPVNNNYGMNWRQSQTAIAGTDCFGTPGL